MKINESTIPAIKQCCEWRLKQNSQHLIKLTGADKNVLAKFIKEVKLELQRDQEFSQCGKTKYFNF